MSGATPWSQGDPLWRDELLDLSHGNSRMARIGCATVCVAEAARRLCDSWTDPGVLCRLLRASGGYVGSASRPDRKVLISWAQAGNEVGLAFDVGKAWVRNSADVDRLRFHALEALEEGGAILHVDHNSEVGGSWGGDHYVYLHERVGQSLVCADPAGGRWVSLDVDTMSGPSPHGSRPYIVRGILRARKAR